MGWSPHMIFLHGKKANERLAEFGEMVLFFVPRARRAKLDLPWSAGVYLGTAMTTNDAFVALPNGDVARSRGICQLS